MAAPIKSSSNFDPNIHSPIIKQIVDKVNSLGTGHPGYISGRSYAVLPGLNSGSAVAVAADTIYLFPFILPRRVLISAMTARVVTLGAGSSGKLAIYPASLTHAGPTGAPIAKDDTGFTTQSNAQDRSSPLAPSVQLEDGVLYWGASKFTGTGPILTAISSANEWTGFLRGQSVGTGLTVNALSMADLFSNTWPTIAGGQAFTELATSLVPQLGITAA